MSPLYGEQSHNQIPSHTSGKSMKYDLRRSDDLAVMVLHEKRLDSNNTPALKAELLGVAGDEISVLFLDVSEVEFCDSSGISALLLAERQMREHDGQVGIIDVGGAVTNVLKIAKLDTVFPIFSSQEEAYNALED